MHEEHEEFVSELLDVADPLGADAVGGAELLRSLRRLIDEVGFGLSEYTGFQNYLSGVPTTTAPATDE